MKKFMLMFTAIMSVLLTGCNREASSVGVIGGADGPTAVFVSGPAWVLPTIIAAVVVGIFLLVYLLVNKK